VDASALVMHGLIGGISMAAVFSAAFVAGRPAPFVVMSAAGQSSRPPVECSRRSSPVRAWRVALASSIGRFCQFGVPYCIADARIER
jgi:hypothetical protein